MPVKAKSFLKFFSPRLVAKAVTTLDKSTSVVVSTCWCAALVTLILAVFSVHSAVTAKRDAAEALVAEPVLPKASSTPINPHEAQLILDRLQHQFPDIKFEMGSGGAIIIRSTDGAKFHEWITSLSYIDAMAPEFRWTLRDFCVGACPAQDLMKAVVAGQKTVFSLPQP
ncbi:MAG: hypothetical protein WCD70_10850 [Alphaproteobacteria bacterium]